MGAGNLLWLCHRFPGSEKGRKQGAAWVDPGALGKMRLSAGSSHISRGCLCLLTLPHSACIHLFFSWIFLFHKTRIAFCSVYLAQPRGAPGQGLLDVITSHNNSRNGSRALCLSQHQDLCLKVGGRACKTEFTAQTQSRCNRSVAQRRCTGKRVGSVCHLVVPNCQEAKEVVLFNLISLCLANHSLWMFAFCVDLENRERLENTFS